MRLLVALTLTLSACVAPPLAAPAAPPAPVVIEIPPPSPAAPPTPPAASEAAAVPVVPSASSWLSCDRCLADDVARRFPKRASLAAKVPLRVLPDGAPITRNHDASRLNTLLDLVVIEERPSALRVVVDDGAVRLLVYVPREGLALVATRAAVLATSPSRAPDPGAGARIAPGIVLEDRGRTGSLHRVAGVASSFRFEGWIADDALGAVFTEERFVAVGGAGEIADGSVITAPSGEVIARHEPLVPGATPAPFTVEVEPLSGAPPGMQAIHLRREQIELRGLVPLASYRKKGARTSGWSSGAGFGSGGFITDTDRAALAKGGGIYTEDGERVGVALATTTVFMPFRLRGENGPLRPASFIFASYGFVGAYVKTAELGPAPP